MFVRCELLTPDCNANFYGVFVPLIVFLTECFEMTSAGLLMSYRMNLCDVFYVREKHKMVRMYSLSETGRNDCRICLNPILM